MWYYYVLGDLMSKKEYFEIALFELEDLLHKLTEMHGLQHGEILHLVYGNLQIHFPESIETYEDGTNPVFYYTHRDCIKRR